MPSMTHMAMAIASVRFLVVCVAQCEHSYKNTTAKHREFNEVRSRKGECLRRLNKVAIGYDRL